jgi:hypothetical protein
MPSNLDNFATDTARRCKWAVHHNNGQPDGGWSMREQLAVALVLRNRMHLVLMGYTIDEAIRVLRDGMSNPPAASEFTAWLERIRAAIGYEVMP